VIYSTSREASCRACPSAVCVSSAAPGYSSANALSSSSLLLLLLLLSSKYQNSIFKIASIGKDELRWYHIISVCGFGTLVSALLLSPAIMYTVLQSGQYVISVQPTECDMNSYKGAFPAPTRDFYLSTAGLATVVGQTDWYLGEWRAYPNARGLCPIQAAETKDSFRNFFGKEADKGGYPNFLNPRYCLEYGREEGEVQPDVIKVFTLIDAQNKAFAEQQAMSGEEQIHRQTDMVDAIKGMRRVAVYILVATITTWCGIFLNFALLPTILYHKGTLIFLNILSWWLPGVFALNEILFGDFNSNHNWDPMFPGCIVYTTVSFTPGVLLLYWQLATLGVWLASVCSFAFYTLCWKNWSSDDEDNVNLAELAKDNENGVVWREKTVHYNQMETQFFKCPAGHSCLRTFGLPEIYRDIEGCEEINCAICDAQGIQEQRYFAYFTYCKECAEAFVEEPTTCQGYHVCMKCTGRWKDGIEMMVLGTRALGHFFPDSVRAGHGSVDAEAVDWGAELSSNDSDASSVDNTRGPQRFSESLTSGLKKMRNSISIKGLQNLQNLQNKSGSSLL